MQLFKVPETNVSIKGYRMVTINANTTGINPMEFLVPGMDGYVNLGRSYFTMELRLKKSDNNNLAGADKLWVVNNLAQTICKQIIMHLNGTLISQQTDTNPYKVFFKTLLNYNREEGDTILKPQGWCNNLDHAAERTANNTDSTTLHAAYRALSQAHKDTLAQDKAMTVSFLNGNRVTLTFQPHLEAFHIGKLLVPQVEIKMRFYSNFLFCLFP